MMSPIRSKENQRTELAILTSVEERFPEDALIKYNLGCYRAVAGRIADARLALAEAFHKDLELRITALDDPDLVGIW